MNRQLALGISLRESASLENFVPGGNVQVISHLRHCTDGSGEQFLYIWGPEGSGKSHLLQAACQYADKLGKAAAYIPLGQAEMFEPEILADLDFMNLVCLDDVESVAGNKAWESALFHLFNRLRDQGVSLITTAGQAPLNLDVDLPDLRSRLSWGLSYQLRPLRDDEKIQALIDGANRRGLTMSWDTGNYILRHVPRDMASLQRLIEHLDKGSLEAQRRLTIPFVKSLLETFG
ncbi:DnaA regulatory inactivator Hda [Solemya velesiana gill symbiont]|uniref:DnaA regulatory inactivator Hda n=1 Tax=Solemya velesiana gill symbiont TaxID=1918948 RepID=A0A1T2KQ04_9GAMM|nr:DnaA regulatory inactivator Hda [Solemya velesiana gill symbiont]OOZ34760.1 DnaA regulatory inactivator Hda [Solemya velesiana gill symbiont]